MSTQLPPASPDPPSRSLPGALGCLLFFTIGASSTLLYLKIVTTDTQSYWNNQFFYRVAAIEEGSETSPEDYFLAFGSSLTRINFIPDAFENTLKDRGREARVFNMGITGAVAFEVDYYLRRTLDHLENNHIPLPRYVLIDLRFPFTGFTLEKDRATQRFTDWHNLRNTLGALESLTLEQGKAGDKLTEALIHIRTMLKNMLPIGRFHSLWDGALMGALSDGSTSVDGTAIASPRHVLPPPVDLSATREEFEHRLVLRIAYLDSSDPILPDNGHALRRQVAYLLDKGVIPIYHLPPSFGESRYTRDLVRQGLLPWLAAYDHPGEYPDLWHYDDRADMPHLKLGEPSERFTRILATDIDDHVLENPDAYVEGLKKGIQE